VSDYFLTFGCGQVVVEKLALFHQDLEREEGGVVSPSREQPLPVVVASAVAHGVVLKIGVVIRTNIKFM
jgi:hypothetical protein